MGGAGPAAAAQACDALQQECLQRGARGNLIVVLVLLGAPPSRSPSRRNSPGVAQALFPQRDSFNQLDGGGGSSEAVWDGRSRLSPHSGHSGRLSVPNATAMDSGGLSVPNATAIDSGGLSAMSAAGMDSGCLNAPSSIAMDSGRSAGSVGSLSSVEWSAAADNGDSILTEAVPMDLPRPYPHVVHRGSDHKYSGPGSGRGAASSSSGARSPVVASRGLDRGSLGSDAWSPSATSTPTLTTTHTSNTITDTTCSMEVGGSNGATAFASPPPHGHMLQTPSSGGGDQTTPLSDTMVQVFHASSLSANTPGGSDVSTIIKHLGFHDA